MRSWANSGPKDTKTKSPAATSEEPGVEAERSLWPPALDTTKARADSLSRHPSALPGHTLTLTPGEEEAHSAPATSYLFWLSSLPSAETPRKLAWISCPDSIVNFYWLGNNKNPGQHHFHPYCPGLCISSSLDCRHGAVAPSVLFTTDDLAGGQWTFHKVAGKGPGGRDAAVTWETARAGSSGHGCGSGEGALCGSMQSSPNQHQCQSPWNCSCQARRIAM